MPRLAGNKWAAKRGLVDDDCSALAMYWIVYLSYHQTFPLTVESWLLDDGLRVLCLKIQPQDQNRIVFLCAGMTHDWSLSMSCKCCFLHAAWVQ